MNFKKYALLPIFTLLLFSFIQHRDAGISFHQGSYASAKKMAKAQNKIIFVDGYTQWCGPCKRMSKEVFTDPAVGSYFSKNFISVKLDMEKTDGMLVGRRYDVNFYPTLLFIKPSGELVRKEVGFQDKSALMKLAREVMQ